MVKITGWKKTQDTTEQLKQNIKKQYFTETALYSYETWISPNNEVKLIRNYNPHNKKSNYEVIVKQENGYLQSYNFTTKEEAMKSIMNFMQKNIGLKRTGWEVIYSYNGKIVHKWKTKVTPHGMPLVREFRKFNKNNKYDESKTKVDIKYTYD